MSRAPGPPRFSAGLLGAMGADIGGLAGRVVRTVNTEVAEYAGEVGGLASDTERAVELALRAFVQGLQRSAGDQTRTEAVQAARELGSAEARAGRTMEALLAAYRVGTRIAWREWGALAVEHHVLPADVVLLAESLFAYIDQLSAASAAGHAAEEGARIRARDLQLARLARALLAGLGEDQLRHLAARAVWTPPAALTAVLVRSGHLKTVRRLLEPATLHLAADDVAPDAAAEFDVLLVPGQDREALLAVLHGRPVVVGSTSAWTRVGVSYRRAVRTWALQPAPVATELVDSGELLPLLVLTGDSDALTDLRQQALLPLAGLSEATSARLIETLRSWLLHQGRREPMANELGIHPQTVRYRVAQLRELFGEQLRDPAGVFTLTLAVGPPPRVH